MFYLCCSIMKIEFTFRQSESFLQELTFDWLQSFTGSSPDSGSEIPQLCHSDSSNFSVSSTDFSVSSTTRTGYTTQDLYMHCNKLGLAISIMIA